jgi:hypothetical protein
MISLFHSHIMVRPMCFGNSGPKDLPYCGNTCFFNLLVLTMWKRVMCPRAVAGNDEVRSTGGEGDNDWIYGQRARWVINLTACFCVQKSVSSLSALLRNT